MTPDQLRTIGESMLYLDRWQTPLARILGIDLRTLQRYASGERPIPREVEGRLYMLVELAEMAVEASNKNRSPVLNFVIAGDGLVHPTASKPFRWVRTVSVYGVPDHLDPIGFRVLARLLRRPRDWTRDRFQWSEL